MQQLNTPGLQKREIVLDSDLQLKIKQVPGWGKREVSVETDAVSRDVVTAEFRDLG